MAATALYSSNTASAKFLSSAHRLSKASEKSFQVNKTNVKKCRPEKKLINVQRKFLNLTFKDNTLSHSVHD